MYVKKQITLKKYLIKELKQVKKYYDKELDSYRKRLFRSLDDGEKDYWIKKTNDAKFISDEIGHAIVTEEAAVFIYMHNNNRKNK